MHALSKSTRDFWAEHAKIVTGANTLSASGGMYANRIALVGTEKGRGVNLEGQITSTQATSLDVNGNLRTSGNLYSYGTTSIHAKDIENSGTIYSVADTKETLTAYSPALVSVANNLSLT